MSRPALSTQIRLAINALLYPVGLELNTLRKQKAEHQRLGKLQAKGYWKDPRYLNGINIRDVEHTVFLREFCTPYKTEYSKFYQESTGVDTEFYLNNEYFGSVDAEVFYSLVRQLGPKRIVEVGSGFSTRLARKAITDGNLNTQLFCIDPKPRVQVDSFADKLVTARVEDIKVVDIVDILEENDILFIDSSHTITTGGDVPYLYLEILPKLKPGVYIHIHDIFFPFDYPEKWVVEFKWGWTEQYLVHAFLCYNARFDILWPAHYMWETHRADILEMIPRTLPESSPSSLWLKSK